MATKAKGASAVVNVAPMGKEYVVRVGWAIVAIWPTRKQAYGKARELREAIQQHEHPAKPDRCAFCGKSATTAGSGAIVMRDGRFRVLHCKAHKTQADLLWGVYELLSEKNGVWRAIVRAELARSKPSRGKKRS